VSPFLLVEKKMLLVMLVLLFAREKKLCMADMGTLLIFLGLKVGSRDWTRKQAKSWLEVLACRIVPEGQQDWHAIFLA
jgi:hypothetical protein